MTLTTPIAAVFRCTAIRAGRLALGAVLAVMLLGTWTGPAPAQQSDAEKVGGLTQLAIEQIGKATGLTFSVQSVTGSLLSAITLSNVRISDKEGAVATVGTIRLSWSPGQIVRGNVVIDELLLRDVRLIRAPAKPPAEAAPLDLSFLQLDISQPLDLRIEKLAIENVVLEERMFGKPGRFNVNGRFILPRDRNRLDLALRLERISGATPEGRIVARMNPETKRLNLDVDIRDQPGGLVSRLIGLPPDDALALTVKGDAPVTDWQGNLKLTAGESGSLDLDIGVRTENETTRVTLDGRGGSQLLGKNFSGLGSQIRMRIVASYGERINVETLDIDGSTGSINGNGWLEPATNRFLFALDARLGALGALEPMIGMPIRGSGTLSARMSGTVESPTIQLSLDARDFRFDRLSAARAKLDLGLTPIDGAQPGDTARDLDLKLTSDQVFLERQTGGQDRLEPFALTLAGRVDLARRTARNVKLDAQVGSATLALNGDLTQADPLKANGTVRFSGTVPEELLYGATLRDATLDGRFAIDQTAKTASVNLDGSAAELKTGVAAVDALITGRTSFKVDATRNDAVVDLAALSLASGNASLTAKGRISRTPSDTVDIEATIPRLAPLEPALNTPISGRATLKATLRRDGERLGVTGTLDGDRITLSGVDLGELGARVSAEDVLGRPSGNLDLRLTGGELTGRVGTRLASVQQELRLSDIDARLNVGRISGALLLPAETGGVEGRLSLALDRLGPLLRLAGLGGSGSLNGRVSLDRSEGRQAVAANLRGRRLDIRVQGSRYAIAALRIDGRAGDVTDLRTVAGTVSASGIRVGTNSIDQATLRLRTGFRGAFSARTRQQLGQKRLTLSTSGSFRGDPSDIRIAVARLNGSFAEQRFSLARPMPIRVRGSSVSVGPARLTVAGRPVGLRVTLRNGALSGEATFDRLPASLLKLAGVGQIDQGTLSGRAAFRGSAAAPVVTFDVSGEGLRRRRAPASAALDLTAQGRYTRAGIQVEGQLKGRSEADVLRYKAVLPSRGAIDVTLKGQLNLRTLSDSGLLINYQMSGRLIADLEITGSAAAPQARGTVRIENGRFVNAQTGMVLAGINATLQGNGREIRFVEASATDGGRGRLTVDGRVLVAPAQGYPLDITVKANRFQAMQTDEIRVTISADVTLSGNSREGLAARGRITVNEGDIIIPERLPPSVTALDVVEVNTPPELRRARGDDADEPQGVTPPVKLELDIRVPGRVFVRGRGVLAEMQGDIQVRGTLADTQIAGRLTTVRGQLDLLGRRFTFREGTIDFRGGDLSNPRINLIAEANAAEIRAIVRITGSVKAPRFEIASEPSLPRDEVLSRIMFGKDVGALGPSDALRLAAGAATLFGPGGAGLPDRIRRAAGLDIIDVNTEGDSPRAVFGKYVSDRVLVKIEQGVTPDSSAVGAEIEVIENFSVETKVGADGKSRIGIKWRYDY